MSDLGTYPAMGIRPCQRATPRRRRLMPALAVSAMLWSVPQATPSIAAANGPRQLDEGAPPRPQDPPGSWPSFRGPGGAGAAADASPPVRWDVATGQNVRWVTPIPGYAHASPVVWGDRIYVTTAISEDPAADGRRTGVRNNAIDDLVPREWKLLALDRQGRIVWERTAHAGAPRVRRHEKGSHANSTPATDGRHVVAVFNSEGLYCWSASGDLLWSRDLGVLDPGYWGQPDNNWGHASSPILFEDTVIVQSDDFAGSFLAAFRLADGEEVWRVARDELATWSTPALYRHDGTAVLVTQGGNHVRAYDPRSGRERWLFADQAEVKVPSPFAVAGLVILTGGAPAGRPIYAVDIAGTESALAAGSTEPVLRWTIPSGGPYTSTPVGYADLLYVTRDNGVVGVFSLADGELLHRERFGTAFSASPVAARDRVYLASEDGDVYVLRAGPGLELLATNPMQESIFATPALAGDLLVVRTRGHLYGIGEPAPAAIPRRDRRGVLPRRFRRRVPAVRHHAVATIRLRRFPWLCGHSLRMATRGGSASPGWPDVCTR